MLEPAMDSAVEQNRPVATMGSVWLGILLMPAGSRAMEGVAITTIVTIIMTIMGVGTMDENC
jgi:hypothetical protein